MEISQCKVADKEILRDLSEKTFRETFESQNVKSDIDEYVLTSLTLEKIGRELENPDSVFFFVWKEKEMAGYLKLNHGKAQTELNDEESIELERIYLLKNFQGRGDGQLLLDYGIDYARKEGKKYLWLGVWEKNERALHFYQKNGFYRFGEHSFQVGADIQLDYLMRKDLK